MTNYRLTYFDFDGGRGEPIRIAFHAAGIEFEDNRLTFAEFGEMRHTTRFNCLPVLDIDGAAVTQSNAIGRYVGKMAGLYPVDDLQALYCDEVVGALEDMYHHVVPTFGLQGDELKKAREKLVDGWLTIILRGLDELLARGGGEYFADNRLTIADLKMFVQTRWLSSGGLEHVPTDIVQRLAPALVAHEQRIASEAIVTAYYASRT
ncbi:MAG: glutathione S-transferase family protein [Gammaproteobacteria bacterium]|nr:glutathione S-transferase family protein [Gammaproteobacteria bacterium]